MAELKGSNTSCKYYPCHFEGQDCTFCFCPFYPCEDGSTGGRWVVGRRGNRVWSCKYCHWIHRPDVAAKVLREIEKCGREDREALQQVRRKVMRTKAACIMVQGTSSFAGKSFLVMALCRILWRRGYRVAPFKAQNTSLNSYVTPQGEEIARAQAIQAFAARIEPEVEMNPILLKPMGNSTAQVVLFGKPFKNIEAGSYYSEFALSDGIEAVEKALQHLKERYEVVVIEGAGSPAEINLYHQDIANMRVAEIADAPVILVADIDRGGVFASIYGTIKLLPQRWRRRVKGVVINKFRGDIEILKPGLKEIEKLTRIPVLGVIPYIENLSLPEEDSVALRDMSRQDGVLRVCVIRLPRISNFTDFDPLMHEDGVVVHFVTSPAQLSGCDAVLIPGTKNTFSDLEWLKSRGFADALRNLVGRVPILGICGGYQMLGERIVDEQGVESPEAGEYRGLGLLRMETRFRGMKKRTVRVEGTAVEALTGSEIYIRAYEIHMGESVHEHEPLLRFDTKLEGAFDAERRILGTYLHGIFDTPGFRQAFLRYISKARDAQPRKSGRDITELWDRAIDRAADVVERSLDMRRIEELIFKRE